MKITHVIRGDDHMINSFKQKQIYDAMGWEVPNFAHIPLIHSEQGKKLSKRDNASTLEDYVKIGIISDSLRNYLLRLGWSYNCLLYTSPSPRDATLSRMPSSA